MLHAESTEESGRDAQTHARGLFLYRLWIQKQQRHFQAELRHCDPFHSDVTVREKAMPTVRRGLVPSEPITFPKTLRCPRAAEEGHSRVRTALRDGPQSKGQEASS